jgi:hypothetical protein
MRYFLQIAAMLGDLMLIGASAIGLYMCYDLFPLNIILLFLVIMNFRIWQQQGGFMAWNPKVIRQFMKNAKNMGL